MLDAELIPATVGDSRQLLVALHGLGDSIEGYRWLPEVMGFPWLNCLLVNAPDLYFGGYSWYDFSGDADTGVRRSRALLFELLDHWRGRGYPSAGTVLFGFSQGSLMTVDVGLRYPHRMAGLIGISGYVHQPQELLGELGPEARSIPILMTHGTFDPLIPFEPARQQVRDLESAGLRIEWHEFAKDHTIAGEPELAVIRGFVAAQLAPHEPRIPPMD
jgi:phospholipase/carboxylesterase